MQKTCPTSCSGLLNFIFLTIANILLPGVERLICIRRILPFDTNQRLHYESDEENDLMNNECFRSSLNFVRNEYGTQVAASNQFPIISFSIVRSSVARYEDIMTAAAKRASCGKIVPMSDVYTKSNMVIAVAATRILGIFVMAP
jgi:hypothetical protein